MNMEVSITKMSKNGQVVIPAEVRKDAGIGLDAKFIVFNEGRNIMLKPLRKELLARDMKLIEKLHRSKEKLKKGKFVRVDSSMTDEDIDDLLMA
jgi:AbrB family looped-hinge helix DNA binding protein